MTQSETYDEFVEQYTHLLDGLVQAGWTPQEAYGRFLALYPSANSGYVQQALNSGNWIFVGRKEHLLNNVMMAAALWYAVAITHDLEPEPEYTAVHLDPVLIQDLPRLFSAAGVSAETTASILSRCGAGLKYLAQNPYTRLDEASYDDFLSNLPKEARDISDDVLTWPPNRTLIEDRLGEGEFSHALLRVGICPPNLEDLGLEVSASTVTDRAFRNALGEFLSYCIRYDRKPTILLYGSWAVARHQLGRVPLLGAIRAKYGSWHRALKLGRRLVNDALNMTVAQAVPARSVEKSKPGETGSFHIEEIKAQGIGVIEQSAQESSTQPDSNWDSLVDVLHTRLRELPWHQTLRVFYLPPESIAQGDYTPYAAILRSPGGYLCEITDSDEFNIKVPRYDIDYLHEHGWIEPGDGALAWVQNFFDASGAATKIINAMRLGLGCTKLEYFQSDDPTNSPEVNIVDPSTGSVPMMSAEDPKDSLIPLDPSKSNS